MGGRGTVSATGKDSRGTGAGDSADSTKKIDAKTQAAIDAYVEDANGEVGLVRAVQQGKNVGAEQEKYKEMGDIIERMIAEKKQEYDTIYRGIKTSQSEIKKYVEGYVFDQKGTSSWSGADGKALEYAFRNDIKGLPVMFVSYGGRNAASIGKLSSLNEDEWLHSKKQKFRVTWTGDVKPQGYDQYVKIIEVEEV